MKKYLLSFVLIVLTAVSAMADRGGYTLPCAMIDAVVHEDNTWDVTEFLFVNFSEYRHGIYKYIPTAFSYGFPGANGQLEEYKYRTVVDNVNVDGRTFKVEDDDTPAFNKIIVIGKPDLTIIGDVKYTINYRLRYLDDRYKGEDFLCHTVWGQGWNTPVDTLYFRIQLEKGFPEGFTEDLKVYSGAFGSKTNADSVTIGFNKEENAIIGTVYGLPANHAVSLSAKLPEGYWKLPEKNNTPVYSMFAIAGLLALILVFMILKRRSRGVARVVAFHPPAGLSSAAVGKVIDNSVDNSDLASLIPWMAHRGYLGIREVRENKNDKDTVLELSLRAPLLPTEPRYMQQYLEALFKDKGKDTIRLDELGNRAYAFKKVKNSIDAEFKGQTALSSTDKAMLWIWGIIVFLVAWGITCASFTGDFDSKFFGYTMLSSGLAIYYMGYRRIKDGLGFPFWSKKRKRNDLIKWAVILGVAIPINIYMINQGYLAISPVHVAVPLVLAGILTYFINTSVKSTSYRDTLVGELMGLRDFIETAEASRIKMLVDENPHYFYEVLPYAIVFGMSDKWVSQFEHIAVEAPDWYVAKSVRPNHMVPQAALSSMTTSFDSSIKSAVASASSSGGSWSWVGGLFSGGGSSYSGGGGGGGGGGSW